MRVDAARGQIAHARIALLRIPKADAAVRDIEGILRGQQIPSIGGKRPVAIKVTVLRRGEPGDFGPRRAIEHGGEIPRAPGKGDGLGAERMGGGGMAAAGQGQDEARLAGCLDTDEQGRVVRAIGGGEIEVVAKIGPDRAGGKNTRCGRGAHQEVAAFHGGSVSIGRAEPGGKPEGGADIVGKGGADLAQERLHRFDADAACGIGDDLGQGSTDLVKPHPRIRKAR